MADGKRMQKGAPKPNTGILNRRNRIDGALENAQRTLQERDIPKKRK